MIIKKHLSTLVFWGAVGMVCLTQPAQAYVNELGLPAAGPIVLNSPAATFVTGANDLAQKDIEVPPPNGAEFMVSSVPVVIQDQLSKNIFKGDLPNDNGGYTTIILQKSGDRFIEVPDELYPILPKL